MKCNGKHDTSTTWTIPRSITFSPLQFMLYCGKSISFGTVYPSLAFQNRTPRSWTSPTALTKTLLSGENWSIPASLLPFQHCHALFRPFSWLLLWLIGGLHQQLRLSCHPPQLSLDLAVGLLPSHIDPGSRQHGAAAAAARASYCHGSADSSCWAQLSPAPAAGSHRSSWSYWIWNQGEVKKNT